MHHETELRIRERVKRNQPDGARGYFLSNTIGRFPSTGALGLDPFQYPQMIPMGSYRLFFTVSLNDSAAMEQKNPGTPPPTVEIWESETHAGGRTELAHPAETGKATVPEARHAREKWQDDPRHISDRIEYQAERFSDELQENKALIGKKLRHSAEVAEGFVLQRAYRHELVAAAQNFSAFQERQVQLFEKMSETHLNLAARLQAPPPPPPPPPDHLGQNLPALLMLGNTIAKKLFGDGHEDDEAPVDATIDDDHSTLLKVKRRLEMRVAKLERDKRARESAKKSKAIPPQRNDDDDGAKEKAKPTGGTKKDPKKGKGTGAGGTRQRPTAGPAVDKDQPRGTAKESQASVSKKSAAGKKARREAGKIKGALGSGTKEKA